MDYRIKDLPENERPREKLEENGVSSLSDVELLSIVLRTGIKGKNVKELSAEILREHGLDSIAEASLEELKSVEGISRVKAGQLKAVGELARRMKREERERINGLEDVKARTADMKFFSEERLRAFYLSAGNEILREEEFEGGVSSVGFDPRKILRQGIVSKASGFILCHNHPSGDPSPTTADIESTRDLKTASEAAGIELLDHVIVGKQTVSLRKQGLAGF